MENRNAASIILPIFIGTPLVLAAIFILFSYNSLVSKEERVFETWSQVETTYQRRSDLVPNLVKTVKAYAKHEKQTLTAVTEKRTRALSALSQATENLQRAQTQANSALSDVNISDAEQMKNLASAQAALTKNLRSFMLVVENYPSLQAGAQFLSLQRQLETTENQISITRMEFNDAVRSYNAATRKVPGNIIAKVGDFQRKAYFEADEGTEKAITVDFGE